jgi:predicted TIM-barrel fold metal-dependent hydrolase
VKKKKVIAIEEHFQTRELNATFRGLDVMPNPKWQEGLYDLGRLRIAEMDEAGIDMQVISHVAPGTQVLDPETAVKLARHANDTLHAAISMHPDRFAGFAELPTPSPAEAADELERTVKEYGFKGAMISGLTHGRFIDEEQFHPILARAQALDVPLYLHPSTPHQAVIDAYYKDLPAMARAGWGFGIEAGTQAVRLIMSGALDRFPGLKIILGHLGEGLPFWLWRADLILTREAKLNQPLRTYFDDHFYVTTSGHFSVPALKCCIDEIGVEKIIFAVDWPMRSNREGMQFIAKAPISAPEKEMILSGNAIDLLRLN